MASLFSLIHRFNLVRNFPVFSNLSWLELRRIAKKSIVEEYKKGTMVRQQNDPADYFYCLISGRLQSYTLNGYGYKENIEYIHRGMYFGIVSVLTGENHSLNFETLNDSIILKIPKADFHSILHSIPKLGVEFSRSLSRQVRGHLVQGYRSNFEGTIISVYSPVKGTGNTTYAVNLAINLERETKKKVILVNIHTNLDSKRFNPDQTPHIYWKDAVQLKDIVLDEPKIMGSIIQTDFKIALLNIVFDPSDTALKKHISPFLSTLVGDYHYVIADLPNDMDDYVFETLTQSDNVHLVTLDRRKDLEQTRKVIDRLQSIFQERFQEDKVRVIMRSVHEQIYLSYEEINSALNFNVYTILPRVDQSQVKEENLHAGMMFFSFDENSEYSQAIKRIARQIGGVMVGLVLGGGAALGVAHVGVIRVLERENIPIDIIVGSSMGALIGSLWATGRNASQLETIAREFSRKKDMIKLVDPVFPASGLVAGKAIERWLTGHLGSRTFNTTKIPFKAVAYDIIRREEIVIDKGSLVEAVRRSIAIPGVIEPIRQGDQMIIDGGVLNPLPTNILVNMGIKKIIAVNVLQSPEESSESHDIQQHELQKQMAIRFKDNPQEFLKFRAVHGLTKMVPLMADIIVRTLQACEYVISLQSAQQANVVIHPNLVGINWFELYKVDDLLTRGEEATVRVLPEIKKLIA